MKARDKYRQSLRGERNDERGATLILTAICMVLLLWGGAMGVDLGITVDGNRQAQAMADAAALDLGRYVNIADGQVTSQKAATWLTNNVIPNVNTDNNSSTVFTLSPGTWGTGGFSSPTQCETGSPPLPSCNAVKVTATQTVPQIFGGGHATVARSAIAAVTPESVFSIGTYLVNVNSSQQLGTLNAILGALGTSVNITGVGYEGLATTDVSIKQLITASGGLLTTSNVMTTSLTGTQWLTIWSDAVANQVAQLNCGASPTPPPCNASTALASLDFSSATSAKLCQLVSINGSSCSPPNATLSTSALSTGLNALQTFTTEAEIANGTSAINLTSALSFTGVTSANLYLTVVQPPQVADGPVGTSAQSAQVTADLQLNLLVGGLIDIPLSAASGKATLSTLSCSNNTMFTTKFNVTTTAASAAMTLAGVGIGTLSLQGFSGTASFNPGAVPPSGTTVSAGTNPKSVGTSTPTVSYAPGISTLSPAYAVLNNILPPVYGPILQAAGVSVGGAQVTDMSTNCGAVSLVQ